MNNVSITGRLGKDPEIKTTSSNKSVTSFSVAVYGGKERTYWIPVVAWEHNAEFIAKHFRKGDGIEISGQLTSRSFQTQDGSNRTVIEVLAREAGFPQVKKESKSEPVKPAYPPADHSFEDIAAENEDLPF